MAMGILFLHEGYRNKPYNCSEGHCTVGVGHLLHLGRCTPEESARQYSDVKIHAILKQDVEEAFATARVWLGPVWDKLFLLQKLGFVLMAFQLGNRINQFKNTQRIILQKGATDAAPELRNSLWFKQTPKRVEFVIALLEQ